MNIYVVKKNGMIKGSWEEVHHIKGVDIKIEYGKGMFHEIKMHR